MPNNSTNKKNAPTTDSTQKSTPKSRKRKRSISTDDESDLDIASACAIEKKLRSVAKMNNLSSVEMKKLIKKLVINDHVLAFITLKAEDELAREKDEAEKMQTAATVAQDVNPVIPKLTRAKARELNKPPIIALPSLIEPQTSEIASLIQEDFHSDEDDGEYTFKDEDFVSDEDPNLTASDVDSQPRTPMTPYQAQEAESPQKFSADGIFKIPRDLEADAIEDEIIAARTRSKFCLQQTTIEDIQSEFVPPDDNLDITDTEIYGNDQDWMEFLNTFSKPLNNNLVGDDDDPVNDPEYVAAEKVQFDAEELRDVNISKKECTELLFELFEGLLNEGVCMESIELETPKKFIESAKCTSPKYDTMDIAINETARQLNFEDKPQLHISDATISSSNFTHNEFSFHPDIMSTPQGQVKQSSLAEELFVPNSCPENVSTHESVQTPSNAFALSYTDPSTTANHVIYVPNTAPTPIPIHDATIDSSSQWGTVRQDRYIAAKKLLKYEYVNKFEKLKHTKVQDASLSEEPTGFTPTQYQILQQQLRVHVQFLTQNFFQTYSHPDLWKVAPQQKRMLMELEENSKENAIFDVWNLKPAVTLVQEWEKELEEDTEENARLMKFIYKEMRKVAKTHNQVSRFSPRIMKKLLFSSVFMYPEYLPRIPFSAHPISFHMFAPSEALLIAMGLEKYLNEILEHDQHLSYKKRRSPMAVACERMTNSIIHGKTPRRLRDHIRELKAASTYNPVKFYYEHQKAPPAEHNLKWIDYTNVLPPNHRITELPIVWREFLQVLNAGGIVNNTYPENYSRYIKEITGEQIDFPLPGSSNFGNRSVKWAQKQTVKENENEKPSVTININYLFNQTTERLPGLNESHTTNLLGLTETPSTNLSVCVSPLKNTSNPSPNLSEGQKKLTDYFGVQPSKSSDKIKTSEVEVKIARPRYKSALRLSKYSGSYIGKKLRLAAKRFRSAKNLQKRYENLLSVYRLSLEKQFVQYKHRGLRFVFRNCKALELYTNLLRDLKMNCKKVKPSDEIGGKRKIGDDQEIPKSRKANRQEENLRHMLLPDSAEDANRKDAIYAFNFYEKVEEVLKQSNKPEDCKKFNHILRAFDPKKDKVADLYYKLEKLFLPDHPELAHVFLTFLLPPEAAEIGKFFEHFMYTNAGTFFNKLNVYFNKQPAQIRKIFNCISELSEDPDVTMDKMKSKIFPLLKGNTFLIDWFTQLFSSEPPPDRLFGSTENTNMKEVLSNQTGEYIETLHPNDLLDSPTESQTCQLKYINGRIFYGTKIPLPAKLSFMATSYQGDELNESLEDEKHTSTDGGCVHGIREYGEKRLSASIHDCSSDDNDKSEEEDSKSLVMATLEGERFETCDDATLRSHAIRLNPSYYSTSCYSSTQNNAPNNCHRPVKLPFSAAEDGKGSPRKAMSKVNLPATISGTVSTFKERRKSPKKSLVKSPLSSGKRAITDNSNKSNAIATAKKLKNLIDDDPNSDPDGSKKKCTKKRKESESKPNEESEGSDGEIRLSPKEEIKEEVMQPWTRDEDKIILEEIKSGCREHLYERITSKMLNRTLPEIEERHKFLMDFLSKLQNSK